MGLIIGGRQRCGSWLSLPTMCWLCDFKTPTSDSPETAHRWQARRGFLLAAGAAVATGAAAQVDVGAASGIRKLVPAETLENDARQQYSQVIADAKAKNALAPDGHPQLMRLHAIAKRLIPHALAWNPRARDWRWQVNLIGSKQLNAWCMPGGKIAFYTGILDQLQLDDDEVAMIMGHEMAHALREHAREQASKNMATQGLSRIGGAVAASVFGIDPRVTDLIARGGANLLSLKFSRDDETEADLVGLEIAARGGYRPEASVELWKKMLAANGNGGNPWLSTHPSGANRIHQLEANLPKVQHLYEQARLGHN
jgi:Zn-dependent protease with chaperone function